VASQPVLIDLPDGTKGLLQPTKRGEIFFIDRTNGKPLAEVKELPVPQGAAEGDWTSPTKPFSTGMPSLVKGEGIGLRAAQAGTPYAISSGPFMSLLAVPCQEPPFGLISGVDLKTRTLLWQKPFGTARDSGPVLLRSYLSIPMGVPNLGGSVTTASGITFIGATQERMLRAYDSKTGAELWKARLPAGGHTTPVTYWSEASQRQFVVIAAGGHGAMLSGRSDAVMAFALPEFR